MRILPLFLSVLMIFAPAYSAYASVLPSKGQIISMGKKGGAMIKTGVGGVVKVGKVGRAITPFGAVSWCMLNKKKCDQIIDTIFDLTCDDMECIVEHPDTPDKDGQCVVRFGDDKQTLDAFLSSKTRTQTTKNTIKHYYPHDDTYDMLDNYARSAKSQARNSQDWRMIHGNYKMRIETINKESGESSFGNMTYYVSVYAKCAELSDDEKRLSDKDLQNLAKKIAENMDDDDIINYYNTDYGDIIINNKRYDGDDINSQTNIDNRCNNNSCHEISQEIEQDVRSKKYDIDDVNEQNCMMDKAKRKYIQCSFDFENGHDNTQDNTNKDDTSKDTKPDEKDEPPLCNTSDFFREACEYFDWVDDEADTKQDKKVDVEDEEEDPLDKEKINIRGACPADEQIALTMPWGYSTTIVFTYKPYCDFARSIKPYMTATGAIVSMYIVGSCGRRL